MKSVHIFVLMVLGLDAILGLTLKKSDMNYPAVIIPASDEHVDSIALKNYPIVINPSSDDLEDAMNLKNSHAVFILDSDDPEVAMALKNSPAVINPSSNDPVVTMVLKKSPMFILPSDDPTVIMAVKNAHAEINPLTDDPKVLSREKRFIFLIPFAAAGAAALGTAVAGAAALGTAAAGAAALGTAAAGAAALGTAAAGAAALGTAAAGAAALGTAAAGAAGAAALGAGAAGAAALGTAAAGAAALGTAAAGAAGAAALGTGAAIAGAAGAAGAAAIGTGSAIAGAAGAAALSTGTAIAGIAGAAGASAIGTGSALISTGTAIAGAAGASIIGTGTAIAGAAGTAGTSLAGAVGSAATAIDTGTTIIENAAGVVGAITAAIEAGSGVAALIKTHAGTSENPTTGLETGTSIVGSGIRVSEATIYSFTGGCPEGFFKAPGSAQCFKAFTDEGRNWAAADSKCKSEGLVLAKPYNAVSLQKSLAEIFGDKEYWLGARGTGISMKWHQDGEALSNNSPLWLSLDPSSQITTNNCLGLTAYNQNIKNFPGKPYFSIDCSYGNIYVVCEEIKCPEGFFKAPGSAQCFKAFTDEGRNWEAAVSKCKSEGLALAKPYNAVTLQKYLTEIYGDKEYWMGARGTGISMKWNQDGEALSNSSPLWLSLDPISQVTTSNCLGLTAYNQNIKNFPGKPYFSIDCSYGNIYLVCEEDNYTRNG